MLTTVRKLNAKSYTCRADGSSLNTGEITNTGASTPCPLYTFTKRPLVTQQVTCLDLWRMIFKKPFQLFPVEE
jgi:hypothetical protein